MLLGLGAPPSGSCQGGGSPTAGISGKWLPGRACNLVPSSGPASGAREERRSWSWRSWPGGALSAQQGTNEGERRKLLRSLPQKRLNQHRAPALRQLPHPITRWERQGPLKVRDHPNGAASASAAAAARGSPSAPEPGLAHPSCPPGQGCTPHMQPAAPTGRGCRDGEGHGSDCLSRCDMGEGGCPKRPQGVREHQT